ncbi:hypothetical protein D9M70_600190 [compost metagenome]
MPLVEIVRNVALKDHGAHWSAFANECRLRDFANGFKRFNCIGRTASNMKFFFCADDEIEKVQG